MRVTILHGAWGVAGAATTAAGTSSAPSGDLIGYALISIAGGALVAFVGPIATAWARTLFHRNQYKSEQERLFEHMGREMEDIRRENEMLREENTELRRHRR
jgi:hypothetical protein